MNLKILIAEDEPKLLTILCDYFQSKGDLPRTLPLAKKRTRRNPNFYDWKVRENNIILSRNTQSQVKTSGVFP